MVRRRVTDGAKDPAFNFNAHRWFSDAVNFTSASEDGFMRRSAILVLLWVPVGLEVGALLSISPGRDSILGSLFVGSGPAPGSYSSADLPFLGLDLRSLGNGPSFWHLFLVFGDSLDSQIEKFVENEGVCL